MRDLNIEPVEELVVTTKIIHEKIGRHEVDTVMTRRKGLHWLTAMSGERVLVKVNDTLQYYLEVRSIQKGEDDDSLEISRY